MNETKNLMKQFAPRLQEIRNTLPVKIWNKTLSSFTEAFSQFSNEELAEATAIAIPFAIDDNYLYIGYTAFLKNESSLENDISINFREGAYCFGNVTKMEIAIKSFLTMIQEDKYLSFNPSLLQANETSIENAATKDSSVENSVSEESSPKKTSSEDSSTENSDSENSSVWKQSTVDSSVNDNSAWSEPSLDNLLGQIESKVSSESEEAELIPTIQIDSLIDDISSSGADSSSAVQSNQDSLSTIDIVFNNILLNGGFELLFEYDNDIEDVIE